MSAIELADKIKQPRFTYAIQCRFCLNKAPMEIVASFQDVVSYHDDIGYPLDTTHCFDTVRCPACLEIHFCYVAINEMDEPGDINWGVLHPVESPVPPGLPGNISQALESALRVKKIDSNAFGVLIGRVLEKVCLEFNTTGDTLNDKINDLAARNVIPGRLAEAAHGLRSLRNIGAHASLGELTTSDAEILNELCRAILDFIYTAPALVDKALQRIETLKN